MPVVEALDYLAKPGQYPARGVCVVFGDETFLKRLAREEIRREVLGADDGEFSFSKFDGRGVALREVFDELSTVALFGGGGRMVLVDEADEFVSKNRPVLEDYVAKAKSSGVLVLDVQTWPKTTRLYKAVAERGLQIDCKSPSGAQVLKFLVARAKRAHDARLEPSAAERLLEIVGPELGLLDQELAKLAVSAGMGGAITAEMVDELVGGWRAKTTWEMLDAALSGNAREAMQQLDRLLLSGEHPVAILAQVGSSMRRLGAATRLVEQSAKSGRSISLRQALQQAGCQPFLLNKAEQQLKQLGRARGRKLYHWLLEADLDVKGQSSMDSRVVLERLIARMSSAGGTAATAARAR